MQANYPTTELTDAFKAVCAMFGTKVRVAKMSGSLRNAVRVVIVSGDRETVRDAAAGLGMVTTAGVKATNPDFRLGWNGDQINLYFGA